MTENVPVMILTAGVDDPHRQVVILTMATNGGTP
jgi:hypothetical protein